MSRGKVKRRDVTSQVQSGIHVFNAGSVSAYSDFRIDRRQPSEDGLSSRAVYVPRQASLRLDRNPPAMRLRPASAMARPSSAMSTKSTAGSSWRSSRPSSAMSDGSRESSNAQRTQPSASTQSSNDLADYWVPDGEGGGWKRSISGSKESTERTGWRRKNVHTEIVEQELQSLARLLHLPPKKGRQSLENYAHELRVAAEYGAGHYSRTLKAQPPSRQVPPSLDFLYKNTGYPSSDSAVNSMSSRRLRPSSGKRPSRPSAHSSQKRTEHVPGWENNKMTPLVTEMIQSREVYLGQFSQPASPSGAIDHGTMEAKYVSLDTAYMTSALDYWDARYLSLMEVMQRASSAKKRARKFIKSSAPSADAESSAWYSPDGHKGPSAPWVPTDRLASSQQSAPSVRRSLNLNSTASNSHRIGASKAPFASLYLCVCFSFRLANLSVIFVCLFLSQFVILPVCLYVYPSACFVSLCVYPRKCSRA